MEAAFRSARLLGATPIRLGLSPVLCGDRNACGREVGRRSVARIRERAGGMGAARRRRRLPLRHREPPGLHQRRAGRRSARAAAASASRFDTGNTFPVAEAPLDFTRAHRAARRAPPPQGLPRAVHATKATAWSAAPSATAAVPLRRDARPSSRPPTASSTAVLEPGALEARHVRLFTPDWWNGYAPKTAPRARRLPARGADEPPARRRRLPHPLGAGRRRASWKPTSST